MPAHDEIDSIIAMAFLFGAIDDELDQLAANLAASNDRAEIVGAIIALSTQAAHSHAAAEDHIATMLRARELADREADHARRCVAGRRASV